VELRGEDLSRYLNKYNPLVYLKSLYDHHLANKAYFSDITVAEIFARVLSTRWRRKPSGIEIMSLLTITLYVGDRLSRSMI